MRTGRSILAVTGLVVGLVFVGCGPVGGNAPETCSGQTFCGGHGTCDDSSGTEVCTCHTGYVGAACQDCDYGYLDNGSGVCTQVDQCTVCIRFHHWPLFYVLQRTRLTRFTGGAG